LARKSPKRKKINEPNRVNGGYPREATVLLWGLVIQYRWDDVKTNFGALIEKKIKCGGGERYNWYKRERNAEMLKNMKQELQG